MNELEQALCKVGQLSMALELAQRNYLTLQTSYNGLYSAVEQVKLGTLDLSRLEFRQPNNIWELLPAPTNPTPSLPLEGAKE